MMMCSVSLSSRSVAIVESVRHHYCHPVVAVAVVVASIHHVAAAVAVVVPTWV